MPTSPHPDHPETEEAGSLHQSKLPKQNYGGGTERDPAAAGAEDREALP